MIKGLLTKSCENIIICDFMFVSVTKCEIKGKKKNSRHKRKGYFVEETNDYSTIYFEGEQVSMRY